MNKKAFLIIFALPVLMANEGGCDSNSASALSAAQVESNQQRLIATIPAPQLPTSLERKNLVKRLGRVNAENMSGFIYLISKGVVMASYPITGKVSSLNSFLAPEGVDEYYGSGGVIHKEVPDFDGAYGKNDDGIFFFTADTDAYVEWHGEYLFSDQPLKMNQQPSMLRIMPSN